MTSWFETVDRTPVTFLVLLAYITLAVLTDPVSETGSTSATLTPPPPPPEPLQPTSSMLAASRARRTKHPFLNWASFIFVPPSPDFSQGPCRDEVELRCEN